MDWKQKEAVERRKIETGARAWAQARRIDNDGFATWYADSWREDEYATAYAEWLGTPDRIEWWAERNGIFVGRGFSRWYFRENRTDPYEEAYSVYKALLQGADA